MRAQAAEQEALDAAWQAASGPDAGSSLGLATEYVFAAENRFDGDPAAMEAAVEAFRTGSLGDACLALEAVVKASPGVCVSCHHGSCSAQLWTRPLTPP